MTRNTDEVTEFTAYFTKEANGQPVGQIIYDVRRLLKLSSAHGGLAVNACNRELTEREQTRDANVEAEITAICLPYGITPVFGGDPRGCTVKLKMPSGATNDWGGVGICVPQ